MTELLHRIATAKSPLLLYLFPPAEQQRRKSGVLSRSSLSAEKRFVLTKTREDRRRWECLDSQESERGLG